MFFFSSITLVLLPPKNCVDGLWRQKVLGLIGLKLST
jgi:hypothetical protein